jgi:hypothetical protein
LRRPQFLAGDLSALAGSIHAKRRKPQRRAAIDEGLRGLSPATAGYASPSSMKALVGAEQASS